MKLPKIEINMEEIVNKTLDEFEYKGLTIREWADKITSGEYQDAAHTKNLSEIAWCDSFICSKCGLHLEEWVKVEITEEYGKERFEYEFEYCPGCGRKIVEGDEDEDNLFL